MKHLFRADNLFLSRPPFVASLSIDCTHTFSPPLPFHSLLLVLLTDYRIHTAPSASPLPLHTCCVVALFSLISSRSCRTAS